MSMKSGDDKPPPASDWAGLALVGQLGLTVVIPILLGIGAGLFIDSKLRSIANSDTYRAAAWPGRWRLRRVSIRFHLEYTRGGGEGQRRKTEANRAMRQ